MLLQCWTQVVLSGGLQCLPLVWHCVYYGFPLVCPLLLVSVGNLPAGEHSFPFQFLLPGEWKDCGYSSLEMVRPTGGRCWVPANPYCLRSHSTHIF